jgi:hypothetical protein
MKLFPTTILYRRALLVFFWLLRIHVASALSPDPRLLSLVVPGSHLVAGMNAPSATGQADSFLLITHNNVVDLEDFFAITGSDPSRITHEVIFTASADIQGNLTEHSILVSGHFDRGHLFRSASTPSIQYRGISVVVVSPLERERSSFHDLRWFTVLNTDVVVFGTVATVQQEVDRYLAGSTSDAAIVHKLSRLRQEDDTWCLLSVPGRSVEIRRVLGMLDPGLGDVIEQGGSFQFGIRTRLRVEFEYEIITSSSAGAEVISTSLAKSLAGTKVKSTPLLPRIDTAESENRIHGVVKVSRPSYDAWLAEVSARGRNKSAVPPD